MCRYPDCCKRLIPLTAPGSTGASRVHIFNHATRRSAVDGPDGPGPGKRVHIDQSYQTAENYVRYYLPDEADELLKKHFQIINVNEHNLSLFPREARLLISLK